MGVTSFKLNTLPGARRSRSIELSKDLTAPERVKAWDASSRAAGGGKHVNYFGQERGEVSRFNRRMVLRGVNVSQENWHHLRSWRDQGEPLALSPLWPADTTLTVLPLGKPAPGEAPLQDFLIADKRSAVDFTRYSTRFHPDTGLPAGFHVPLYTDGWKGEQINVGDVINDAHFPSFEYRAYVDRDAADVGSITRVYLGPRYDADSFWVGQLVMVQTRELTTNKFEAARVDAINSASNYMDLSLIPAGDAVLTQTSDYTYANRTSVSNNLCPDGDMSDSGVGSWTDENTPELTEKSKTFRETGQQGFRIIGGGGAFGKKLTIGSFAAGTDLVVWCRVNVIRGVGFNLLLWNLTDGAAIINEATAVTGWQWMRFAGKVADGATDPSAVRLYLLQDGAGADTEFSVDRIEIYQNGVVNGGMEGPYDNEAPQIDVAPDWTAVGGPAAPGDTLSEDADEHGGEDAQGIDVDAGNKGVETDTTNVFVADNWYLVGAYFKVDSGEAMMRTETFNVLLEGIDDAAYTFHAALWPANINEGLMVESDGGAADFRVDDVFAVRLPHLLAADVEGGPFDDAFYDLPLPLDTTAFTFYTVWNPGVANTEFASSVATLTLASRREPDLNERMQVFYAAGTFTFRTRAAGAGVDVTVSKTFSAGDTIIIFGRYDGGDVDVWVKVGTDAVVTDADVGSAIGTGITRLFFRANSFMQMSRGAYSATTIINEALSDATILDMIGIIAGSSGYEAELTLLEETYGIIYEIEPNGITPWHPADGEYIKCDIALREVGRIGAFSNAY